MYFGPFCCTQLDYVCICADGDGNSGLRKTNLVLGEQIVDY